MRPVFSLFYLNMWLQFQYYIHEHSVFHFKYIYIYIYQSRNPRVVPGTSSPCMPGFSRRTKMDYHIIILSHLQLQFFLIIDHGSTTMFFHTILLYTVLWQGRCTGKRCRALARAQIHTYTHMHNIFIYIIHLIKTRR